MARRAERRNAQRQSATASTFWNDNDAADEDLAIAELPVSDPPLPHVAAGDDVLANLDLSRHLISQLLSKFLIMLL